MTPTFRTIINYDHIGRVLAERQRIGVAGVHDARERAKRKLAALNAGQGTREEAA